MKLFIKQKDAIETEPRKPIISKFMVDDGDPVAKKRPNPGVGASGRGKKTRFAWECRVAARLPLPADLLSV